VIARLAALALAAGLAGAPARAEPVLDTLQKLCVDTNADPVAALAAADADGWMPLPKPLLESFNASEEFTLEDGRMKSSREGLFLMAQGSGARRLGFDTLKVRLCAVGSMPGEAEATRTAVAEWAGVPPEARLSNQTDTGYVFEEKDGVRTAVGNPNNREARKLLGGGNVRMVFVRADEQIVLVAYAVPTL
jgi:hypothetical protein